ncbi:Cytochrome c oxidase subunit 2 [bacterium HR39]|nr:Cytochrome c oxidase subunit 2 [bacterium HR39]
MQPVVLIITVLAMAAIAAVFAWAIWAPPGAVDPERAERWRIRTIVALTLAGVVLAAMTLVPWPHAPQAGPTPGIVVHARGYQWYWELDRDTVPAGTPVTFLASTADVTHGFGVADPQGRLLFQVQVIPGYVSRVDWTFDRPGTYRVICLEYCGIAHHEMMGQLTVQPGV